VPLLFVLAATLWGGSFVAIEAGVSEWPALLFAAVRYDLAGVVVLGLAVGGGSRWRPRTRDDLLSVAALAVFVVFAHHALLYVGQETVPGAVAAAVVALSPVLTALFAPFLLDDEGLASSDYAGVAVGFLGVLAVTDPFGAGGIPVDGALLVLGATAAFALGSVLLRRTDPGLSVGARQGWGMVLGAGLLHAGSLATGEPQAVTVSTTGLLSLAFLVLGPGVVAYVAYFELLDAVGATRTNLVGYLEPLTAAALSFAVFGYVPSSEAAAGFCLVLVGFGLLEGDTLRMAANDAAGRVRTMRDR
jgi:drug/metabolite transporter (DMT)-like permease